MYGLPKILLILNKVSEKTWITILVLRPLYATVQNYQHALLEDLLKTHKVLIEYDFLKDHKNSSPSHSVQRENIWARGRMFGQKRECSVKGQNACLGF